MMIEQPEVSGVIVDAAMKVHTALGPGLLENAYHVCMTAALRNRGLRIEEQVPMPIYFEGARIDVGYRLDLLVEREVIVELKAVTRVLPVHHAQIMSYMRLGQYRIGLLLNFHVPKMRDGIVRFIL